MAENTSKASVQLGTRVSPALHARIVAEQKRLKKTTGIEPSLNEVTNMLIERGLEANGKKG